ncbi:MAG: ATP-binding protein [Gemmatimonadaceae bacterium]
MPFQTESAAETKRPHTLWTRLGFRDDPYYVEPLPVDQESLDLFVGREEDRRRLLSFVRETPTGKTMLQGAPGVGKTSLVNVVQQELFAAGERCPLLSVIEVPADQTREAFLLTVISGVVSSLDELLSAEELQAHAAMTRAREAVSQTVRSARDLGMSATLPGGMGAGLQAARSPVPTTPLAPTVPTLLSLLNGLVEVLRARGFVGLIVPVNNLDTLTDTQAAQFLNISRDITMGQHAPSIHWMFIAGPALFHVLETRSEYRRISESFTNNPVTLGPLAWTDVEAALERRCAYFALEPSASLPVSMTLAREIYEAGGGELRFTMARLSRTVREFAAAYPSERKVPDAIARALLSEWGRAQLRDALPTEGERRVLAYLQSHETIRSRDFAAVRVTSAQRLSQVLGSLVKKHYLQGGNRMAYRFTPAARFALYEP